MASPTISWVKGSVKLIDQTKLPAKLCYLTCRDVMSLCKAIKNLSVRGAPALGVAAGFGVLLSLKTFRGSDPKKFRRHILQSCEYIGSSRPTAVNLFNVLNDMMKVLDHHPKATVARLKILLKKKAIAIYDEDKRVCRKMGANGADLIQTDQNIMTVCNTGALATVDYGTALGVMYSAKSKGKKFSVYICETRPLLQGARLTAWELLREKIDTTLICDNMAATLMQQNKVDSVFAGADRIASNGDTANKIGTYSLAVLAKNHGIPFYIVAPLSTFDLSIKDGSDIPIEQRNKDEVLGFGNQRTAPAGVKVYNPAFDVTEAKWITAIITEAGILKAPYRVSIKKAFKKNGRS